MDKIYLRENGAENDPVQKALQPFVDAGVVDFGFWPGPRYPAQTNWYNECSDDARKSHGWIGFPDLDEFIVVLDKCVAHFALLVLSRASARRKHIALVPSTTTYPQ